MCWGLSDIEVRVAGATVRAETRVHTIELSRLDFISAISAPEQTQLGKRCAGVCLCVYVSVYLCVYICIAYRYVHTYTCKYTSIHIYTHAHAYAQKMRTHIHAQINMYSAHVDIHT